MVEGSSIFGDLVRSIKPYLTEVVFVGGWVHALYIIECDGDSRRIVRTSDIDLSLPQRLELGARDSLKELISRAGFEIQPIDGAGEVLEIFRDDVDLDLLAEAAGPLESVSIEGQPELTVFGYPHQNFLQENVRWMEVGPDIDPLMDPPVSILVPELAAYAIGKLLSSARRTNGDKKAKDLVYLDGLLAREPLRTSIEESMPNLLERYPAEGRLARAYLESVIADPRAQEAVSNQIIMASGFGMEDSTPVQAQVLARFRRFLVENLG